ncbi:hypothetical protein M758_4G100500 [Ceratodon purpureus]|uniref:Prolyl endopeptidase n=1 Tax=Ceratodon purpureus TaxID=3225 RepID=A0A8T0I7I9_CERPU|nr:hypothetical protein KC19_4G101300 [Ceratodon purpureus]KAG0618905.1 hypothetical protein M758_4G100500 [Ceratodon purpureus]
MDPASEIVMSGPFDASGKTGSTEVNEATLLEDFLSIPSIEKAWTSSSWRGDDGFDVIVEMSQVNLSANARRTFMSTVFIPHMKSGIITNCRWAPFPFELCGASLVVPSPSGERLLIVRNNDAKTVASQAKLEIWGQGQLLKEMHVPASVHGSVYSDEWFQGVSWSENEDYIAYVAEEPAKPKPVFGQNFVSSNQSDTEILGAGTWEGQGDWMEDWGETYTGKRRPVIFVANVESGAVQTVEGIPKDVSAGQVVWAPRTPSSHLAEKGTQALVFVGWSSFSSNFSTPRKLGMVYCQNKPCYLYAVEAPVPERQRSISAPSAVKLTEGITSALFPRFSPNGQLLVFLSCQAAVNSGVHTATNSLHSIKWPAHRVFSMPMQIKDVVKVVQRANKDGFPGLYCADLIANPWVADSSTLLLSSVWRSQEVILAVDVESGDVIRVSPANSLSSWKLLGLQSSSLLAVASSPNEPDNLMLGSQAETKKNWTWINISVPSLKLTERVNKSLKDMFYKIIQIPVPPAESNNTLTEGARQPFEVIFVSRMNSYIKKGYRGRENGAQNSLPPLLVILHGGPHSIAQPSFSKPAAFLSALGFSLLHVNYRGSIGFGEEALQSLPGNIGRQDVGDVLAALNLVVKNGLADPNKVSVMGGSHGGFLASHLLGQAPDKFRTGILRSPVCNLASNVGSSDIPDWCYVEAFGKEGLTSYSEAPSADDLRVLYQCSPIAHVFKVRVPTLFILGAQDRRVPAIPNGLQYAQALRARGLEAKVIVVPDQHSLERPQTQFEGYLNIGLWLKRFK